MDLRMGLFCTHGQGPVACPPRAVAASRPAALGALALLACTALGGACTPLDAGTTTAACSHALPPERPDGGTSEGADADEAPLVFVARAISAGLATSAEEEPAYLHYGFDLDGLCTGQGEGSACVGPAGDEPIEDGPGGRDHLANRLVEEIIEFGGPGIMEGELPADSGRDSLLVRLLKYNGQPDDDHVELEYFHVTLWDAPNGGSAPRWEGDDEWRPFSAWVDAAGAAKVADRRAYVSDGMLVARFDRLLTGPPPQPSFTIYRVIMTGQLVATDEGVALTSIVISARNGIDDVLDRLAITYETNENSCRPRTEYEIARDAFCATLDLTIDDGGDPQQPCTAFSSAFYYTMYPARLGEPIDRPVFESLGCPVLECDGG